MTEAHRSADSDAKAALRHALELIQQRGWCQAAFEDDDGSVCALGAINRLDAPSETRHDAKILLAQHLGLDHYTSIMGWNDAPGRSAEEVMEAFRKAAS